MVGRLHSRTPHRKWKKAGFTKMNSIIRILIVEDDPDIARAMHRYTENLGFSVTTVSTVRNALNLLQKADILILDIVVNGGALSGDIVLEKWTQSVRGPVCVVNGPDRCDLIEKGADIVLEKPIRWSTYASIMAHFSRFVRTKQRCEEMTKEMETLRINLDTVKQDFDKKTKRLLIGLVVVAALALGSSGAEFIPRILEVLGVI